MRLFFVARMDVSMGTVFARRVFMVVPLVSLTMHVLVLVFMAMGVIMVVLVRMAVCHVPVAVHMVMFVMVGMCMIMGMSMFPFHVSLPRRK